MKRRPVNQIPVLFPEMSENPWFSGPGAIEETVDKLQMSDLTTLELCAGLHKLMRQSKA